MGLDTAARSSAVRVSPAGTWPKNAPVSSPTKLAPCPMVTATLAAAALPVLVSERVSLNSLPLRSSRGSVDQLSMRKAGTPAGSLVGAAVGSLVGVAGGGSVGVGSCARAGGAAYRLEAMSPRARKSVDSRDLRFTCLLRLCALDRQPGLLVQHDLAIEQVQGPGGVVGD